MLFAKSLQDLIVPALEDLAQNTRLTRLSPGGKARALLESVNKRLSEGYEVFDLALARAFVTSAPGQYLELIGALLGVHKQSASAASVSSDVEVLKWYVDSGTFGNINNNANIEIGQGEIISTGTGNSGILYRTLESVILPASSNSVWFSAEAVAPGEDSSVGSNELIYHSFIDYIDHANQTLLVTNVHPIANGKNFESDENYRFRIANRVLEVEAANETAIRLAALSTPGVADVLIQRYYRGLSTFGVIIKSVLPTVSNNLIDNVTSNIYLVQALGDVAFIRKPKETGLELELTIHYRAHLNTDELTQLEENITEFLTENVNSLDIGESLMLNPLVSGIFALDSNIINIGQPNKPIDAAFIYKQSRLQDNKIRQKLLQDYSPVSDERVIIEPILQNPIVLKSQYKGR
jgi:uncharacterized phage protein gp47/JayE